MALKYAAEACLVTGPDGVSYEIGTRADNSVWDASDPLVVRNPGRFSDTPPRVNRTVPIDETAEATGGRGVERATRAPGEKRQQPRVGGRFTRRTA